MEISQRPEPEAHLQSQPSYAAELPMAESADLESRHQPRRLRSISSMQLRPRYGLNLFFDHPPSSAQISPATTMLLERFRGRGAYLKPRLPIEDRASPLIGLPRNMGALCPMPLYHKSNIQAT